MIGGRKARHLKKSLEHFLPSDLTPVYAVSAQHSAQYAVQVLCQTL